MNTPNGIFCGEFAFCGKCEKCICRTFVRGAEDLFTSLTYQQKFVFFVGLFKRCNTTLVASLLSTVRLSDGKERIYSISKTNPLLDELTERPVRSNFGTRDVNYSMMNVFLRFLTFSDYQKKIAFFQFFKLCDDRLLAHLASQMYDIVAEDGAGSTRGYSSEEEESDSVPSARGDTPITKQCGLSDLDDLHNAEPLSNYETEDDGFDTDFRESTLDVASTSRTSRSKASSIKRKNRMISIFNDKSGKDFLSALPIGIAKRILGYLDNVSLANCLCVSTVWRNLAEEVRAEVSVQEEIAESVKLMQLMTIPSTRWGESGDAVSSYDICAGPLLQGSSEQQCNPKFARFSDVLVPTIDIETGKVVPAKKNNSSLDIDENSNTNYNAAFSGLQTRKIIMEERNVYCGPFNVMVVYDKLDPHRVLNNDGSNLIASGSSDRKICLHDIVNGCMLDNVLEGHSGSIKCIKISTADGLAFTGSYDTGVRVWDLKTGKFIKVFSGHQATVLCLAYENQLIVSGSVDRTCRVWSIKSLRCIRKFYHRSAVTAVAIRTVYMEERVVSGDVKGHVKLWNLRTGQLMKVLHGHSDAITAIDLDRWFVVTASKDCYAMGWSSLGDHKRCLFAFAHPQAVLTISLKYLRAITGCADGRIRIWSVLNGYCVKVLRGNSKNDAILSLDCTETMLTINTESNVIVMKFEPVKYNYTTSELYLPNSSLKTKNKEMIKPSDSETDFDSNGEPLVGSRSGSRSRPHSAVRATRMHLLQCASREIHGSRPASRRAKSSESLYYRSPSRSASAASTLKTRPETSPQTSKRRQRPHRRANKEYKEAVTLPDPDSLNAMLDHRCYPLRHCDLEAARRIQAASTLPPWQKDKVDFILREVREEHRRLVERRRAIREARANKTLETDRLVKEDTGDESGGSVDDLLQDMTLEQKVAVNENERNMLRRMTWSFHRANPATAGIYPGKSPVPAPPPEPPSLESVQKDLRDTMIPGARPPSIPYVHLSVAEVMRQDRDELTVEPPVRLVPPENQLRNRISSLSFQDKQKMFSKEDNKGKQSGASHQKEQSSADQLRSIVLSHAKERHEKRISSALKVKKVDEPTPEEAARAERDRLLEMAEQVETGGWDKLILFKKTEKNPVAIVERPSPVEKSVFPGRVRTAIPKPVEIVKQRPMSSHSSSRSKPRITTRPPSAVTCVRESDSLQAKKGAEPVMQVPNYDNILEGLRNRVDAIKHVQAREALRRADSQFDFRSSPDPDDDSSLGPKPLQLSSNAVYDRQTEEFVNQNIKEETNRRRKLDVWRRKKWSMLAAGKITPNQLHDD